MRAISYWLSVVFAFAASSSMASDVECWGEESCSDCQNHVQPDEDTEGYHAAVSGLLLGNSSPRIYQLWLPSFLPEAAISLAEREGKWFVQLSWVERSIWRWKQLPDRQEILDFDTDQDVARREREFPPELAHRIAKSWSTVLQRTRHEQKSTITTDGEGYVFAVDGLSGWDANLRCGIGSLMLNVGGDLARYVKANHPVSRWSLRVKLRRTLSRIEQDDYPREATN